MGPGLSTPIARLAAARNAPADPQTRRVLAAMTPAGFLSVIPAAASSSRNRAAGSAETVIFSAIPIRSWTGREVERADASDDVMGLLRFGWEKESPAASDSMRCRRPRPHGNVEPRRAQRPPSLAEGLRRRPRPRIAQRC